jgi:hypothetical protein
VRFLDINLAGCAGLLSSLLLRMLVSRASEEVPLCGLFDMKPGREACVKHSSPHSLGGSWVFKFYQEFMKEHDAIDFDDMLINVGKLMETHPDLWRAETPYTHVLIDEVSVGYRRLISVCAFMSLRTCE